MALESSEWEMFLRRMIARNLRMFGAPDPVAVAKKDAAGRLQEWSRAQVGLHSIQQFEGSVRRVAEQEQDRWQFEEEIKALGAEEVRAEFTGYFSAIVSELGSGNARYGEAVRQLEGLLELERETLIVRRKASTAVSMDIFKTGANTLLEQSKGIQGRKAAAMAELVAAIPGLEEVQPITQEELQPFQQALLPN